MNRALLGAALAAVAAALVPTASAKRPPSPNLALVPLPRSAVGPASSSFSLSYDSGPVSNANAASHTASATPSTLRKLGRVRGYGLEYGNAFTGAAGITSVRTSIEEYKTFADARRALVFWQKNDAGHARLNSPGFSVTSTPVQLPAPASKTSHFAYLTSYSAANIAPVSGIDEQVADGRYVLAVIVTAGAPPAAERLASTLAVKLDRRFRLWRQGRLHARPVKLRTQRAEPPPGGPDLSALALRKTDLVGKRSVSKGYVLDPTAISDYSVFMLPAGQFDALDQEIEWFPAANEASFFADFENATALATHGTTALDLSGIGDNAQGSVTPGSFGAGQVFLSSGHLAEFIFMGRQGKISGAAVTSVAQAAADRIDAAGLGT